MEHPFVAFLLTDGDDAVSWLQAGQALERVLLELTDAGAAAQPLTQLIDLPVYREQARTRLRLLAQPQMLLRMGATAGGPGVPRRALDDVVDRA